MTGVIAESLSGKQEFRNNPFFQQVSVVKTANTLNEAANSP